MQRRQVFAGAAGLAAALAAPGLRAQAARVLKVVPQANLPSLDPVWASNMGTRNHGYMVYDTLFGTDDAMDPQPQMAAGQVLEDDGLACTITLRPNLRFHDGERVRAADAVASIRRWGQRSPFGQKLIAATAELTALDDDRLRFRLHKPFPLLRHALAAPGNPCFVMPARVAAVDGFTQIRDATGSGPFIWKADEFVSGSLLVYTRNPHYVPVSGGAPSLTAGPKQVHFDRVEKHVIADAATASAALQRGEMDWFETPGPEIVELFRRNRRLVVEPLDRYGTWTMLRLNHLHPPFADRAMRRALLPALSQADFMTAIVGPDAALWRDGVGAFVPDTPMASTVGLEVLTSPRSLDAGRAAAQASGQAGEVLRLLGPTDAAGATPMTEVAADLFRRMGLKLDLAMTDWGTVVQRRASREPVARGGWSALATGFSSFDCLNPASHWVLRGNGAQGWFGWPDMPELERLRDAWFDAADLATQQAICARIQAVVMAEVPFVPLGMYLTTTVYRVELRDRVQGLPLCWGIRRV